MFCGLARWRSRSVVYVPMVEAAVDRDGAETMDDRAESPTSLVALLALIIGEFGEVTAAVPISVAAPRAVGTPVAWRTRPPLPQK